MTVTAFPARNEYTASGGQTVFNYTFLIFNNTDLNVYVTPVGQDSSDVADIISTYTVDPSTIGNPNGGFITLDVGVNAGDLVTIVSSIPDDRTTDYKNSGDFRPTVVNADFDRTVSLVKQQDDRASRTLAFPESQQNASALNLALPEAGLYLRWRTDETGTENAGVPSILIPQKEFATVTDLQATPAGSTDDNTTIALNDFVILQDYATGHGSGVLFGKIVAGGTGTEDGGSFINLTASGFQLKQNLTFTVTTHQFGAHADGLDTIIPINKACDYAKANGGGVHSLPGVYLITDSIFTGVTKAQEAADDIGSKGVKSFTGSGTDITLFLSRSNGVPIIENTGGRYQVFNNFTLEGDTTTPPNIGILNARVNRNATAGNAPSAGEGWFSDIEIRGFFTITAWYNYGAEAVRTFRFTFENRNPSGVNTIFLTDTNIEAITSPKSEIAGTVDGNSDTNDLQSSIGHYFTECQIFDYTASAVNDTGVDIVGCKNVHFNTVPNYTLVNSQAGTRYFRCRKDLTPETGNGGTPTDIQFKNVFYHESAGEIAVFLTNDVIGFRHEGCRGAQGGIVCDAGVDIFGEIGAGEHNKIEAFLFDGQASKVEITIVDFALLSGDTLTLEGVGIASTVITEGVNWSSVTDNDTAAANLATYINGLGEFVANAVDNGVTITPATAGDVITSSVSSDETNMIEDLKRVSVLGFTDMHVDVSFKISSTFIGNLNIPDGGLTALEIADRDRFNGRIYHETGDVSEPRKVTASYFNSAAISVATGVDTLLTFNTKSFDSHGTVVSSVFAAPTEGLYRATVGVGLLSPEDQKRLRVMIFKNSGEAHRDQMSISGVNTEPQIVTSRIIQLDAGETISFKVNHNYTATPINTRTGITLAFFDIEKVS